MCIKAKETAIIMTHDTEKIFSNENGMLHLLVIPRFVVYICVDK